MKTLAAVLVPLAAELPRRARYAHARRSSAGALRASAAHAGAPAALPCTDWPRDADGAPSPVAGWHASFADTTGMLVALVAPCPVGVDVEWLARPRIEAARARFQQEGELARLGGDDRERVLALWTAKEALLKRARRGLADLGRCALVERVVGRLGEEGFLLRHGGAEHLVRVHRWGEHILAVACEFPCTLEVLEPAPLFTGSLTGNEVP